MKVDQEDRVSNILREAKLFLSIFDDLVSNLSEKDIKLYRNKIEKETRLS